MEYRTLGRSGCAVSNVCLGTMTFGVETDEAGSHEQLDRFVAAGGTLVDTADVYGSGRSEEIIGRWFATRPADVTEPVVLATKGRFATDHFPNGAGLSARHLTRALDAALRRLGREAVDLYQVHAWDPLTPLEETVATLDGFVRAGKIRYFGSSTFPAYRIVQAQWAAREHHLNRYVTEQPSYSILQRGVETHVLPVTGEYGLGVLAWSPLASGWLSGAVRAGQPVTTHRSAVRPERFDLTVPPNQARMEAVEQLAGARSVPGATMASIASSTSADSTVSAAASWECR